ncbi:MAG: HAD family phosphatase [Chitinophagaceae bacterium]|nr:HAD family phosphatase [Chitinophagaceae bacterium]MBP9103112.1 HAD family phosphatase [Chitinophagaceae bacterium]
MINTIIFDLGGVLIDWNPDYVFTENYFDSQEQRTFFFQNVCTPDWNENQDAGYPIAKATEEKLIEFPEWENPIKDFYGRWVEMLGEQIQGTVDIFKQLKENKNLKFYALTNWSAETFPIAIDRFDFLQWFDGLVVSGEEKMRKPFPEFYKLLLNRYNVNPEETLFIDDNLRNVKAAEALGIKSIYFKEPLGLDLELKRIGIY